MADASDRLLNWKVLQPLLQRFTLDAFNAIDVSHLASGIQFDGLILSQGYGLDGLDKFNSLVRNISAWKGPEMAFETTVKTEQTWISTIFHIETMQLQAP